MTSNASVSVCAYISPTVVGALVIGCRKVMPSISRTAYSSLLTGPSPRLISALGKMRLVFLYDQRFPGPQYQFFAVITGVRDSVATASCDGSSIAMARTPHATLTPRTTKDLVLTITLSTACLRLPPVMHQTLRLRDGAAGRRRTAQLPKSYV